MQAKRLHERHCAGIRPDASGDLFWSCPCGFEVRMPLGATKRDRATATHKKYVHHKNCRGGGDGEITCPRCNKIFPSVRARAAHEPSSRCCNAVGATLGCAPVAIALCMRQHALVGRRPLVMAALAAPRGVLCSLCFCHGSAMSCACPLQNDLEKNYLG